ncbi:RNA polymerase II [Myxozyma melibiosi]|uniref:DNA-directed RNA polymerase III subunit RPC9 n=1 Tax=Myxozyma melibiosi TaxID=54550 RepID=A0ABR1F534_9ASCO
MKAEVARDKLLSNFEVLQHINDIKRRQKQSSASRHRSALKTENLETILLELHTYLGEKAHSAAAKQNPADIKTFMQEISVYDLEKAEKLQIINIAPTSLVTLYCLIEEYEQRFTEEQGNHMLELIQKYLHPAPPPPTAGA